MRDLANASIALLECLAGVQYDQRAGLGYFEPRRPECKSAEYSCAAFGIKESAAEADRICEGADSSAAVGLCEELRALAGKPRERLVEVLGEDSEADAGQQGEEVGRARAARERAGRERGRRGRAPEQLILSPGLHSTDALRVAVCSPSRNKIKLISNCDVVHKKERERPRIVLHPLGSLKAVIAQKEIVIE